MSDWIRLLEGDCRETLRTLEPESVQCCVTSPPYWGLRDYGNPGQIGLERTPDEYIGKMLEVFAEVWRVLRDDGTLWLNLGDCYATGGGSVGLAPGGGDQGERFIRQGMIATQPNRMPLPGLKPKDLVGIPWRMAFALQQPREIVVIKNIVDRAWLAAMIDGEGCITTTVARGSVESGRAQNESYAIVLQVRMSDRECLDRIVEITGMSKVQEESLYPSMEVANQRPASVWKVSGENAATLLAEIYPFLLIKRRQAIAAWNLQRLKDGVIHKRGLCIPAGNMEMRRELHRVIRSLNQREKVDVPGWCLEPSFSVMPGWYLRSDVIWHKPNPMPESVTDRPTKAHEYIFLLTKSERYFYDSDAIAEPQLTGATARYYGTSGQSAWNAASGGHRDKSGSYGNGETRNKRTVWSVSTHPYSEAHFATYPPDLIRPCILAGSRTGDTVLDPFGGSGTTGMVAIQEGRKAILCELNPEYAKLIEQRTHTTPGLGL